jgi:hypothetical protein
MKQALKVFTADMKLLQLKYHWMKVRGNVCNKKALTETAFSSNMILQNYQIDDKNTK